MKFYSISEIINYFENFNIDIKDKKIFTSISESAKLQSQNVVILINHIEESLSNRFKTNTLTYDHFNEMVIKSIDPIVFNYEYIQKIIDNFNNEDYKRLQSHNLKMDESLQMQKLIIYETSIERTEKLLHENEEIMLQLNKIISEIEKSYDENEKLEETKKIVDELVNDLKYYKNN